MEKLICSGCGAALTLNTTQPYLVCEYCDTAVPNAFYAEPAQAEAAPVSAAAEEAETVEAAETDPVSALVETVGGVARTLLQRSMMNRALQRSVRQRPVMQRTAARPAVQRMRQEPMGPVRVPNGHGMRGAPRGGHGGPGGRGPGGPGRGRR